MAEQNQERGKFENPGVRGQPGSHVRTPEDLSDEERNAVEQARTLLLSGVDSEIVPASLRNLGIDITPERLAEIIRGHYKNDKDSRLLWPLGVPGKTRRIKPRSGISWSKAPQGIRDQLEQMIRNFTPISDIQTEMERQDSSVSTDRIFELAKDFLGPGVYEEWFEQQGFPQRSQEQVEFGKFEQDPTKYASWVHRNCKFSQKC